MIAILILAAAAAAQTPVDAERAFATDARTIGQWTAFNKWSTDDAVMFTPEPTNAHAFLKDRKDPAQSVEWWPTEIYVSCDDSLAVNTGGWKRPDGSVGYFTTVWKRQPDGGWKWVLDHGDTLASLRDRSAPPRVTKAACRRPARRAQSIVDKVGDAPRTGMFTSMDGTLNIAWSVFSDLSRTVEVSIAKPGKFKQAVALQPVLTDRVAAPK